MQIQSLSIVVPNREYVKNAVSANLHLAIGQKDIEEIIALSEKKRFEISGDRILEVCVGQIGDKLETDFAMAATDSQAGIRQYLISIDEIQNTNAEIRDATAASIAEYQAQRDKFRGFL